jgi:predicted ester cyclase
MASSVAFPILRARAPLERRNYSQIASAGRDHNPHCRAALHQADAMTESPLAHLYRDYIACLNRQEWENLYRFVDADARHNGRPFGLAGYRAMLERDFAEIPDLQFNIELMVCEPPHVASWLRFDCRPKGLFLGLPVNGKRVCFAENVFYKFRGGKIVEVWSVIDKAAIEAQL